LIRAGCLLALAGSLLSGCTSGSQAAAVGLGGGLGAYAGAAAGHGSALASAAGGTAGALLVSYAESKQQQAYQAGADEGYLLGSSDAVKRLYWAKQALEKPDGSGGHLEYFSWDGATTAADGRKLAPEKISVPVFAPDPVGQP